eukprot:3822-Heterococcus_DN1.PRE.2
MLSQIYALIFAPASRFRHVSEIYLNLKILPRRSDFDDCAWRRLFLKHDCSCRDSHNTNNTHKDSASNRSSSRHTQNACCTHNSLRHRLGVNQLSGSSKLDAEAQAWANTMASHSRMYHSGTPGENLYWSSSQSATAEDACRSWAAEERFWTGPGVAMQTRSSGSAESKTGNWASVGHFTQMAWHSTTHVGCGIARGRNGTYICCRYSPPGNMTGSFPLGSSSSGRSRVVDYPPPAQHNNNPPQSSSNVFAIQSHYGDYL